MSTALLIPSCCQPTLSRLMGGLVALATLIAPSFAQAPAAVTRPLPVIFDTDIGNDVDDCLALAMLHSFASRGDIRLAAVTITKDNPWAPRLASAINRFYGRPGIPIGVVSNGQTKDDGYLKKTIDAGHYGYSDRTEDAVALLRRVLNAEADGSVVIVQVGFSTNLAHLLEAPGGRDLVAKKVSRLVLMAGNFDDGQPEYNVKTDVAAAQKVARDWPTPVYWSGFEVGRSIKYPAASIVRDFGAPGVNPVADAYRLYMKMPYDRETWDLTAALYAVRPGDGYLTASEGGVVEVDAEGRTKFQPRAGGLHHVLLVNDIQRARILEAFLWLCTESHR
ncbi:MAG: nucleoside hydrolase [Bryobacteraceae bacterium]|nr:nucleoside hydrolase [Bryobacteraceae bacterium]